MKIVVIGGSGLIGSKVVIMLSQQVMRRLPHHQAEGSTPSRAKEFPR